MSTKDRLERKKYMGVWRWESELMAKMMSRFPNTVIRYMERKSPNMRGCSSCSSESPRRINSEIHALFSDFMGVEVTTRKKENHMASLHTNWHNSHS